MTFDASKNLPTLNPWSSSSNHVYQAQTSETASQNHTSEFDCSSLCSFSWDDLVFSSNFPCTEHLPVEDLSVPKNGNSENRISWGFMVIFKYWITERRLKITLIIFLPSLALPTLESCTPYHANVLNVFYKLTLYNTLSTVIN